MNNARLRVLRHDGRTRPGPPREERELGCVLLFRSRGVKVQVCGENASGEYDDDFAKQARVFIGSENFSDTSLNQNRELGLITSSHAVMSAIASTFAADFRDGKKWS